MQENLSELDVKNIFKNGTVESNDPTTIGIHRRFNYLRKEFGYNDDYFIEHVHINQNDLLLMKKGYNPEHIEAKEKMMNYLEIYESAYLAFLKKNDDMKQLITIF